jgi:hypothetical protein
LLRVAAAKPRALMRALTALAERVTGRHAVIETNLYGTWYMMQEAGRRWIARDERGSVINMVIPVQRGPRVGIPHTMASRAGQIAVSRTLAVEWAPHDIRINCIALGVFASPGLERYPPTARRSFAANPMRRLGDVHDVAEACVYLSAPSGRFITQGHPRVNLVTDILPAMALVRDPAEPGVMRRPPRDPREPLVTWARAVRMLGEAACLTAGVASAYLWVVLQEGAGPRAHTLAFVVLVLIHPLQAGLLGSA